MTSQGRKNKDISGYQILCILAEVDGHFDPREGNVIVEYISIHFPLGGNLTQAMEELSTTPNVDYDVLFHKCAADFYADSTEKERITFIQFALDLIKADEQIKENENLLINKLYQYWDIN